MRNTSTPALIGVATAAAVFAAVAGYYARDGVQETVENQVQSIKDGWEQTTIALGQACNPMNWQRR